MRTLRPLALILLVPACAVLRPAPAAAQDVRMCTNQPVPPGMVVVGVSSRNQCPVSSSTWYNSLTVRAPGDTATICNELSLVPQGYAVTGVSSRNACPVSSTHWYNAFSIRQLGDTATICHEISPPPPGYVVISNSSRNACPVSSSTWYNAAAVQRVGPAPAQDLPAEEGGLEMVNRHDGAALTRLDEMEERLGLERMTHYVWLSRANGGTTARTEMQVQAGMRYTLAAACDDDCGDLDLRVLEGGYVVTEDVSRDPQAAVNVSPARDTRLTVEVVMASCGQSPCHFAVGVYETPRAHSIPPRRP